MLTPSHRLEGESCCMRRPLRAKRCGGAMTAEAIGGLEYSPRRGCVANAAHTSTKCGGRLLWGLSVLRQLKLARRGGSLCLQIEME